MTETDISKVLIEGEYATIMGVKYKRVEEPKPQTLYDFLQDDFDSDDREIVCEIVERWLPPDDPHDGEEYQLGWNACLGYLRKRLK